MALRLPTADDLQEMAAANYFELSEDELASFQALLPGLFQGYEELESMPEPREPLKYRDRDSGYRPSSKEDPFNAVLRRCSVKGASSGKLAGKRFGLKNNVSVAGMPVTLGSLVMEGYVAQSDATVVTRLLDAGAEIVANLNLDNFAFSGRGDTSAFGAVRNPHNPDHLAGGSSGGSGAALYYDDIDITIGGDQGGSIRIPASWCGVVGLKPTHGLVPYTGIGGFDNTYDHAGPMARSVEDAALTLEVIAGKDPLDPRQPGDVPVQRYTEALGKGVQGMRIGVVSEGFGLDISEPDVDASVRKAVGILGELGATVSEVSIPDQKTGTSIAFTLLIEGCAALIRTNGVGYHWQGLYDTNFMTALGKFRRTQANDFPPTLKLVLLIGSYMAERYYGATYGKAQNLRRVLRAAYDRALEQFDVLALPTAPMKSPKYEPDIDIEHLITDGWSPATITCPTDMTGHPALSVPCGKSNGLPVGLMLIGKRFDDASLFQVAHAFEQHANWETL